MIILTIPVNEIEERLKMRPKIVDRSITINRFASTNKAMAVIFAEYKLNLDTGRVRVIFMVLCENSDENKSIAINAVKSGNNVFASKVKTDMGKMLLSLRTPIPMLLIPIDINFPIAITAAEIISIINSFFFLYIFSNSFISAALNPSMFVNLAYKVVFK